MYPHRLPYRFRSQYAPMPTITQWHARLGTPYSAAIPQTARSRYPIQDQPHCSDGDGQLGIVVWWVFRPYGRSAYRMLSRIPPLVHTTFIAGNDEQQMKLLEATMGISLFELARRRTHRH
ncbi:hypothetical protein BSF44_44780 [Pseudomonas sp. ACN8]|jgi:hypothetical protein|nr:hypothetical protein BSF44_44780 [Pseudomonas sp. ACN8]